MRKESLTGAISGVFASAQTWASMDRADWRKLGRIVVLATAAWALVMGAVVYQTNGFYLGMSVPAQASECLIPSSMSTDYTKFACRVSSGDHFAFTDELR